jgi:hypothetical protein
MRLNAYGLANLNPPPPKYDLGQDKVSNLGMMLNDKLGDCAIAAPGHLIQLWTADCGKQVILSDEVIEQTYQAVGGYVPGDASTDNGCVMLDVLKYWRNQGIGGHYIKAFGELSRSRGQIQLAVYYLQGAYLGFALPAALDTDATVWDTVPSGDPKTVPGSLGGHAICAVQGYDEDGFWIISWGTWIKVTWEFYAAYADEQYGILTPDQFDPNGTNPLGLNLSQMNDYFAAITS